MAESGTASGSWRMGRPGTAERMAAGPELGEEGSVTVKSKPESGPGCQRHRLV